MGLTKGDFPPVDPATFPEMPYRERIRTLASFWAEYGFGAPKTTMLIYIAKLFGFFCPSGVLIATLTSGLNPFEPSTWWDEPLVWQKLVIWTFLCESLGIAGMWGPLMGHFRPWMGGSRYWARPGTIRLPPWPAKVPFTEGDERTVVDVGLYVLAMAGLVTALLLPGIPDSSLTDAVGANRGLVSPAVLIPVITFWVLLGLRDKAVFITSRCEQYLPALVFFAFFPFVDMVVAAKLLIAVVWIGAGFSKIGSHFSMVVSTMVSNIPWLPFKAIKRLHYTDFPRDLRPSRLTTFLAHGPGLFGEIVPPLVLLFSPDPTVTVAAVLFMITYHVFITSTFPVAVPLEWNALFIYLTVFYFLGFPNHAGYGVPDMNPALLAVTAAGLLLFPVLGNLRPDLVSFLPAMRQYSGNWATSLWALAPGAEAKLDEGDAVKSAEMQKRQLTELFDEAVAEVVLYQLVAWRALHSQGRGLQSVMMNQLGADIETYALREGEFCCNVFVGMNIGDGHLHDDQLIAAIQKRCRLAPGELIVVCAEAEPFGNGRQQYIVVDAAIGIVERGSWAVADCVKEQPWLPNGPVPTQIEWRMPEYERVRHGRAAIDLPRRAAVG